MSIFGLPLSMFQTPEIEEDLPDHFISLPFFRGASGSTPEPSGQISLGVNDIDTVKPLIHDVDISVGTSRSIHEADDSTPYQNLSGNDAFIILILQAGDTVNGVPANYKIWDSPTTDTATGTERFDTQGGNLANNMNATQQRITLGPFKISNNNYCVINPIANSDLRVRDYLAWVVERG